MYSFSYWHLVQVLKILMPFNTELLARKRKESSLNNRYTTNTRNLLLRGFWWWCLEKRSNKQITSY